MDIVTFISSNAAEHGNAEAMRNLGICYATGRGIKSDKEKALRCFITAARKGDKEAQKYADEIVIDISNPGMKDSVKKQESANGPRISIMFLYDSVPHLRR